MITDHSELNAYLKEKVPSKGRHHIFLDEIQRVRDWERSVNSLMVDTESDIYITGSNAHLLSTDLSTYLTTTLLMNIVDPISSVNVAKELHMNVRTVERYLSVVQSACMFYRADRYDLRSTVLSPTPKYYAVDQGLCNNAVGMASKDRILENMVYLELRRRGYGIMAGRWDSKEVDFVTEKKGRRAYWQVSLGYPDDVTEERELAPLRAIKDNNPKNVIFLNRSGSGYTKDGIREIAAVDFFMQDDID